MANKRRLERGIAGLLVVVMLLTMVPLAGVPAVMAQATTVFVNEIHYDNDGTDAGEAIEIAGEAGTDLSGWSLVLYNGNGGTVYNTTSLSGLIPDQQGGYGTVVVTYPVNGIQNGSPDGLALVDAGNGVVQFLSYEGTFMAVGGPADGMMSTDIGVAEPYTTPIGHSLQLAGEGTVYEEFAWVSPAANTFGEVNAGQTFAGSSTPDMVISEIRIDQPSDDFDEYFELVAAAGISLDGLTYLVIGDGTAGSGVIEAVVDLTAQSMPASGYFVAAESTFALGTADLTANLNFENSDNVTHLLVSDFAGANGDDLDADDDGVLDVTPWSQIVDCVALIETVGSGEQVYCDTAVGPDGSYVPGHAFLCPEGWQVGLFDPAGGDDTPGAANACVAPIVEVVINEIIQNPNAVYDSAGEWFELYNPTGGDIDINGWTIQDNDYDSLVINNGAPLFIPAGGYLVLGNNADSTTNGGASVDYQYESFFLGNSGDEVVLIDARGVEIDRVEYDGGPSFPDPTGASMSLVDPALDNNVGENWCTSTTPFGDGDLGTPGSQNTCEPQEGCGDPFTPIYTIQGNGPASPLDGTEVSTEGIVVGDFQDGKSGYYIQDALGDGDVATSDGIFVYSTGPDVNVGDHVRVRGYVDEYYDLTEVTAVSQVWSCSTGNSVAPTALSLPVTSVDDFEAYEGMLVTFPQTLYISEYYGFGRYGEIVLTTERQFQPTAIYEPGSGEAAALAESNLLSRITIDDGRGSQNPDPAIHPNGNVFDLTNLFRGGDTVLNMTGVVDYNYGAYKVQPTQGADYVPANPRTGPDGVGGNLAVASFNVLNYFTTLGSRGADTPEEFTRQRDKIFAALAAIDADVVGLIEIENNGIAVADLVDGLNLVVGADTYTYINTGPIGVDEITVAFIYKPATVSLVGNFSVLDDPSFTDPLNYGEQKSRPALAQTFMDNTTGGVYTVVVNHLKSKGTPCGEGDDDPVQGNCNVTRTLGAEALADWLATDPTGSGDADFLIIGDLNAYDKEDPIDALVTGGYADLIYFYQGEYAYSYVFDGQLGYLDHALANSDLAAEIAGVTVWHINADEPSLIDYDLTFKADAQDAIYAPDAYRSSDHDPVIAGLAVCDEIAPTFDEVSVTPDRLWPVNHKYVEVTATVVFSDNFDDNPTLTLVSVTSNEPDDGLGDGDTPDDIVIVDDFTFKLRAERAGGEEDRIYTITYLVTDACGNSTEASATVTVPHDMGQ